MRDFKFRVWENVENKMNYDCIVGDNFIIFNYTGDCEDDLFTGDVDFVYLCELNRKYFEIMQYTGIKDIHGQEIYEGDIVVDLATEKKYEVFYDKYKFELKDYYNPLTDYGNIAFSEGIFAVIGNVYENKDLLE